MIEAKRLSRRIGLFVATTLVVATLVGLSSIPPSAAQGLDPAAAKEAQRLEDSASAARQKAAVLLKNATAWDSLIKSNREKAAAATDAKARTAFEELAKKQEDGARKMRDDADTLTRSADADANKAAQIRGGVPSEAAAPARPSTDTKAQVQPPKKLLDYAEVAKADIAVARPYLQAVATEITELAKRFDTYREQNNQFKDAFDRDIAEARELEVQHEAGRTGAQVRHFPLYGNSPDLILSDLRTQIDADWRLSTIRTFSVSLDRAFAQLDSLPTRWNAFRFLAAREHNFFGEVDGIEQAISNQVSLAVDLLWGMHLQEATWEYRLLSLEFGGKVWSIQKPYAGEMNAIEDAYVAELDHIDTNIRKYFNLNAISGTNISDQEVYDIRDRPSRIADDEFSRRVAGVCYRSNDQVAPYVTQIAARVQAIAEHLKETHSRLVEDFRRVVAQIERDKSGAKADIFAPADRFLENAKIINAKIIATETEPGSFRPVAVVMYVPFAFSGTPDIRPCGDWSKQMPNDLGSRFPAVTVAFEPTRVRFFLVFNQNEIVQGEADARRADARP